MSLRRDEARRRLAEARVGRLATTTPDGAPHVVACCFALLGERIYSAVDRKPKRSRRLQRVANVTANPRASLLVDHYDEDWSQLWWVRVDGVASVVGGGGERDAALAALAAKYAQYTAEPPDGAVIAVAAEHWRSWSAR